MTNPTFTVSGQPLELTPFYPRNPQQKWATAWLAGHEEQCDLWLSWVPLAEGQWLVEGEASNASFAPGVPARPTVRCKVDVVLDHGWTKSGDLEELPSALQPKRAALFRFVICAPENPVLDASKLDVALANWQESFGPLGARLARDPFPNRGAALARAYHDNSLDVCEHEDSEDSLRARQVGPTDRGEQGGTGITPAYSWNDPLACRVMAKAVTNRGWFAYDRRTGEPVQVEYYGPVTPTFDGLNNELPEFAAVCAGETYEFAPYDWEHYIRQMRYAAICWAMTRHPIWERQLVAYGEYARLAFSERGPTNFAPGWYPSNIHQLHEAAVRNPGEGLPGYAGRYAGWIGWAYAWRLMVRRGGSRAFAQMFLSAMEVGANPVHGVVQCYFKDLALDPEHPEVLTRVEQVAQCFEVGILAHACVALARLIGAGVPQWPQKAAMAIANLEPVDYYGLASPPHFLKVVTASGNLEAVPQPLGDPAFGWHEELCAVLFTATRNQNFLAASCRFHAVARDFASKLAAMSEFPDDQDKRLCIEARGVRLQ